MKSTLLLFFIGLSSLSFAQQPDSCQCSRNLTALTQVAQKRYAGFEDKVNTRTKNGYDSMLRKLQQRAYTATGWKCSILLEEYVSFFKDKHFFINTATPSDRFKAVVAAESMDLVENKLSNQERSLPIEGIWHDLDGHYQVAIYKSGKAGQLTGAVLKTDVDKWRRGVVKFKLSPHGKGAYTATYYGRDFKPSVYSASLIGDLLKFSQWGGSWFRSKPRFTSNDVLTRLQQQLSLPNLTFQVIENDFCYLKINSFSIPDNAFDQVLRQNRDVLSRRPFMILDLRGNAGGSGSLDTFGEFLRLAYTQPIISSGITVKVSPEMLAENMAQLESFEAGYATFIPPANRTKEDILAYYQSEVRDAERNMGKLVSSPGYTYRRDSVLESPLHIAVLLDDRCASTTEALIDLAKQSKKVTLFGTHSMGVMDYGGIRSFVLPCGEYSGYVAPVRTDWALHGKIDNVGFLADVSIPPSEVDWVEFVMKYYSSQKLK
jgi:hypothetical protein